MDLVPEKLLQAHEDCEVIFFCGAGVSVPAGMPTFEGLVENILKDLAANRSRAPLPWKAFDEGKYDEVLDILERHEQGGFGFEILRERVREMLERRPRTLQAHMTLARLADLDKPEGRLVTTNFDPLFERAMEKLRRDEKSDHRKPVDIAPALPPPKVQSWHTLIHLHGKLDHSPGNRNLILTTADFGAAYLLDRWASRFVTELFRNFHVIFIGYSIEDPTMRYLVNALAAAREDKEQYKPAFTFAPYGEKDEYKTLEEAIEAWKIKGVEALPYDSGDNHRELWQNLEEWGNDHRGGLLSRRRIAAQYGKHPPVGKGDVAPLKLTWALKDPDVARHFAQLEGKDRPDPGWIVPLQDKGLLNLPIGKTKNDEGIPAPLVSRTLPDYLKLHDATYQLGKWIVQCLDSQEALDWALGQGGVLHHDMRWYVQAHLKKERGTNNISAGLKKIWQVLARDDYAHALSAKNIRTFSSYPPLNTEDAFAKSDFLNRLKPIPVFTVKPGYSRDQGEHDHERPSSFCDIKIDLVGIEGDYDIDRLKNSATDWEGALATMAEEITTLLHEAMDWQRAFGLASAETDMTYIAQPSVSPHKQNKYSATWTQLIKLARDSFDALAARDEASAERLARRWQNLDYPIFRRLALYAATGGSNA